MVGFYLLEKKNSIELKENFLFFPCLLWNTWTRGGGAHILGIYKVNFGNFWKFIFRYLLYPHKKLASAHPDMNHLSKKLSLFLLISAFLGILQIFFVIFYQIFFSNFSPIITNKAGIFAIFSQGKVLNSRKTSCFSPVYIEIQQPFIKETNG